MTFGQLHHDCNTCLSVQAQISELEKMNASLNDISEEKMAAIIQAAQKRLVASQEALDKATHEVEAAKCEVAGIESGDGRDESNRSLPERLRDTKADIVRSPATLD
jgi:prophage DNA circulation protein